MKYKGLLLPAYILILVFTAGAAYWRGRRDVWIWEYKTYHANLLNLTQWHTNEAPVLTEFVKARYYYCANKLSDNWLGGPYDFGPMTTNWPFLVIGKGPTTGPEEYRKFKERGLPSRPAK